MLAALAAAGCVAPVEPVGDPAEEAIVGGSAVASAPGVLAVFADGALVCSGALIAERVALTAAHCVDGAELRAGTGTDVATVVAARVHPDRDVALLTLDRALATDVPWALVAWTLDGSSTGMPVWLAGYGAAGDDGSGRLHVGLARLDEVTDAEIVVSPDPAAPCHGDSGGPMVVEVEGEARLVAVTSSGDAACRDRARGARVDALLASFILPVLRETSGPSELGCEGGECAPARCFEEAWSWRCPTDCATPGDCLAAMPEPRATGIRSGCGLSVAGGGAPPGAALFFAIVVLFLRGRDRYGTHAHAVRGPRRRLHGRRGSDRRGGL